MKKHEMVLDFTSLLDVILIILFLVLCSMNGKAQKDAEEIEDLKKQNAAYETQAAEQGETISKLEKENRELEQKLAEAQAQLEKLNRDYEALQNENEYYKQQAAAAQENLKKYMEIAGLSESDRKLFGLFEEKAFGMELTIMSDASSNENLLILKKDGKKIGDLKKFASGIYIPADQRDQPWAQKIPENERFEAKLEGNKKDIVKWLTEGIDIVTSKDKKAILLISIDTESYDYSEKGLEVLMAALSVFNATNTTGYTIYYNQN